MLAEDANLFPFRFFQIPISPFLNKNKTESSCPFKPNNLHTKTKICKKTHHLLPPSSHDKTNGMNIAMTTVSLYPHRYHHHNHHLCPKLINSSKPIIPSHGFLKNLSFSSSSTKHSSPSKIFCSTPPDSSGDRLSSNFCIIEGPETVQDFVQMQLQEIQDNIRSRRNKIFLLMEELRRLRVQQRIRLRNMKVVSEDSEEDGNEMPDIPSSIPFLPNVTPTTLKQLYLTSLSFISGIIVFGGFIAPTLELKLGIGGTSYEDFIRSMHLPMQLSQVDPIVASFSGGAVGVISALMLIEANNVEQQEKKRCKYCHGTGYLACARCSASGVCLTIDPISMSSNSDRPLRVPTTERCLNCSGAGKVMCPTCLCTGMMMASEHDPRFDPFD